MKQNFIIKQMTQKKTKNSKIVVTKKLRTPDQRFNARIAFWKPDHRKNLSVVFGAGDKCADRQGCELSGAGERDRDRLGMPEEDSTAGVVSGTRKSPVACDVTGVGGITWTGGGMV